MTGFDVHNLELSDESHLDMATLFPQFQSFQRYEMGSKPKDIQTFRLLINLSVPEINTCQNIILKKICFGGTLEATNIKLFVDGLQAQFLFDWDRFVLGSESRSWAVCANALKSTLAFVVFSDILGILAPVKCHKCHLRQPRNVVLDAK